MSTPVTAAPGDAGPPGPGSPPGPAVGVPAIRAVPVRHPGRYVAVAVMLVLAAMFVNMILTNDAFQWRFMYESATSPPVLRGVRTTITLTVICMAIGVVLGVLIAVMRLSHNVVLSGTAWLYIWFFRAIPRVVLLLTIGNLGILYEVFEVGLPFDRQIGDLIGVDIDGRLFGIDARTLVTAFVASILGLALSEAAYMAEIVRGGINAVDEGQGEAAAALGLTRGQTLRRIVLPQAMRVIVPPTGNETIAMLKDTSLVAFVPLTTELFFQLQAIGGRTFQPFPTYIAATLWYLLLSSVLLVGQYFLEKRFSRGDRDTGQRRARTRSVAGPA